MKYPLLMTSLLAGQVFAGTMGSTEDWHWIGALSVGPVWQSGGETQTFYLAPNIIKTWSNNKSTTVLASGELFVGIQQSWTASWIGQWGLAFATTGDARLQGIIWDSADPLYDNYSYQYKIANTRIAAKGKLMFDQGYLAMPYISATLGVGFNRAHDYINTPLIFEAVRNNNFTDRTKTAFTYTIGAGLQKTLSERWQMGVGYEFADWGKSGLGLAIGQTLNTGLTLDHLYTNGLLFNLTYIA